MKVGNTVTFEYKGGRKVTGKVISIKNNLLELSLHTDYLGKNCDWYKGEEKIFNYNNYFN